MDEPFILMQAANTADYQYYKLPLLRIAAVIYISNNMH